MLVGINDRIKIFLADLTAFEKYVVVSTWTHPQD